MRAHGTPDTGMWDPGDLLGADKTDASPNVRIPPLARGETTAVVPPPAESRRMAKLIPGARLELMSGGGHMLMLEQTDELDRLIVDFAREVQHTRIEPAG